MFLSTEEKDERRLFAYEERSAALKRSRGRCACCGKKLTTKTMTMDHIIPCRAAGRTRRKTWSLFVRTAIRKKAICCIFRMDIIMRLTELAIVN